MKKNLTLKNLTLQNSGVLFGEIFLLRLVRSILVSLMICSILCLIFPSNLIASENSPPDYKPGLPTLLVLGDSLSASFGIEQSQGWVSLLVKKLERHQYRLNVVNASISGETTQGGLQRLPALLVKHKPALVMIELGGNDGLRGLQLSMIKSNLQNMINDITKTGALILLTGIRLPPNYGQVYTQQFYQIYMDIAEQNNIPLIPFILEGIAKNKSLMQADGIHPTAKAQPAILENVWAQLLPMLDRYLVHAKTN